MQNADAFARFSNRLRIADDQYLGSIVRACSSRISEAPSQKNRVQFLRLVRKGLL
jgi:hypothetical protein